MPGLNPVAAAGFGAAADVYERARPSYPEAAVDWIARRAGLRSGATVVDVGAGTGKLTRLLVPTGARVIAVEPLPEMRAKLVELVPDAEALEGTAESLPLPDRFADAVTVAQAFHWFDPPHALPELYRVLRPGGVLVLVWNSRQLDDALQQGLEDLLAPLRKDVVAQLEGAWRMPLERSRLFGRIEEVRFPYEQSLTTQGLCERVASTSFVAAMRDDEREELLSRVRELTVGRLEPFPFPYVTEVYVTARSRRRR
jgi:SAM-dependent methyltransferase